MNLKEFKHKLFLENESVKNEYEKYDLAFEIGQMVIDARIEKGLTQKELATLVGTKQPSIARLENGQSAPSLRFLAKIAKALGTELNAPKFASRKVNQHSETINMVAEIHTDYEPRLEIEKQINSLATKSYKKKLTFS